MALYFGKYESQITVPTGGWTGTLGEATGAVSETFTIAAGTYYHSDAGSLAATLEAALEAASVTGGNSYGYTVTPSFGEGGTGKTTITFDGAGTFDITWISTDLRDLFGWTTTPSAVTTTTSENHARSIWLPPVVKVTPYGDNDDGHKETDANATEGNSGQVKVLFSDDRTVLPFVEWSDVKAAKTRISYETVTNESFEKFYEDSILGKATWSASPGGPLRLYWDSDTDTSYLTHMVSGSILRGFVPIQVRDRWTGSWKIVVDRLIKVPT